jgi:hypothetical protein
MGFETEDRDERGRDWETKRRKEKERKGESRDRKINKGARECEREREWR